MHLIANFPCGSTNSDNPIYVTVNSCSGGGGFFTVSPNPADDKVVVELDQNEEAVSSISTFSTKLYNDKLELLIDENSEGKRAVLNTGKFPKGIYYLNIYYLDEVWQEKILIE